MSDQLEHARGLLLRASHDLEDADIVIATRRIYDTVCFHSQQAVEKSLKALLSLAGVEYPWTHDLGRLMDAIGGMYVVLTQMEQDITRLTGFAVDIRYRIDVAEPTYETAQAALDVAHRVYDFAEQAVAQRAHEEGAQAQEPE